MGVFLEAARTGTGATQDPTPGKTLVIPEKDLTILIPPPHDHSKERDRMTSSTEHWIRLRGGWDTDPPSERRISLPLNTPEPLTTRSRLVRPFQKPPLQPGRESLWIHLADVPGLVQIHLNGEPLPLHNSLPNQWIRLADDLPQRNRLVLEVEPLQPSSVASPPFVWGSIALVIRAEEPLGS